MLKIENVSKTLGNKKVLDHCNLTVPKGSIVGVIGINGAGKSTLFRLLSGVYDCDEGTLTFDREPIYENVNVKKDILFLSDDTYYPNHASLSDMKDYYRCFYSNFNETKYKQYLALLKLDEHVPLRNFSKGMRKQAFISVMLSMQPKLLIMDETFDGLDPLMRLVMKQAISEMVAETDASVLISSHSLHDIESICDHYVILDHNTLETSTEMDQNKERYHRYQLAFNKEVKEEDFDALTVVDMQITGRVVSLVVEGEQEAIEEVLHSLSPVLMDSLDLSLEELFISKVKGGLSDE